ncbi:hypothetical protein EKO27_g1865 [Xylaria grammica]|uniref:Phytocyanin domain-containing protein n=1 Tax=Xylaria grammica TaxID=363999 RepID=A0A439DFQ1_9PEZI|nr:hypothetical protein EKO27_g1865 [Xylaria grammica]
MSWFRPSSLALGLVFSVSFAAAVNIEVTVGKDSKLEFNPASITAQIGDTITYKFFSKNHAVAQSTFADPCHLQENGIFSGFTPNASPDVAAPTDFTITINDTKPLWFYCPQTNGNHCQNGMVHAINAPNTGNTFDAYMTKAKQAATPSTPAAGTLPLGGLRKLHIDVGFNGELMFNPNNVTELVGTVVEFSYNPANHSIVQSSFDKPCQPIEREGGGFIAPFVPTQQTPSGVTFEVTLTNSDPIWFYCAQTKKSHCQSGMDLAAKAPPSTIGPDTPVVGALKLNGTFIANVGGNVLDTTTLDPSLGGQIPPPEMNYPPYIGGMAGGNQPANYNWGDNITDEAVAILRSLQYIDNFIVVLLLEGFNQLSQGQWSEVYPGSITQTLGSLVAQSLIHRRTYTDSLQHFGKEVVSVCGKYDLAAVLTDVDTWLSTVLTGLHLSIGATLDALTLLATSDPWTTPALATGLGSQARMSALLNLMQNHVPAAAPREVLIPNALVTSYIASHYATDASCTPPSDDGAKAFPALVIKEKSVQPDTNRVQAIVIEIPKGATGGLFIAWLGPWGGLEYTSVDATNGTAGVPDSLSGHVWAVLTNKDGVSAADLDTVTVAGPEIMWVSQQWSVSDF